MKLKKTMAHMALMVNFFNNKCECGLLNSDALEKFGAIFNKQKMQWEFPDGSIWRYNPKTENFHVKGPVKK